MNTALLRTIRLSLTAAAVLGLAACGGDANEQGAATIDTGAATVGAAGGNVAGGTVSPQEAVAFMAAADQSEVAAAQVAVDKATNPQVRQFAQLMQREHSESARQVGQLANQMNVSLEASAAQGQMVQQLQQMAQQTAQQLNATPRGAEFDRVYMESQVQAHQMVLDNLQRIAGGTAGTTGTAGATTTASQPAGGAAAHGAGHTPASPQAAAQMMIPKVQQHLERARQIQSQLGGR